VLKLYAWEQAYKKIVSDYRQEELVMIKKTQYLRAISTFSWTIAPFFVSLATFIAYTMAGNDLTPDKAFVALSLFNLLRFPLVMLPMLISAIVQAMVSAKRVQQFLQLDEVNEDNVDWFSPPADTDTYSSSSRGGSGGGGGLRDANRDRPAVEINGGMFAWNLSDVPYQTEPDLAGINLTVPRGSLTGIVGTVGCGKSTLLNAMLGNLQKLQGSVSVVNSVAYVPQEAWIRNTSVRHNITFGLPFNPQRYQQVLESCALLPDLVR
jgi:ABC-type multidrug transport system fused ATPase/permease subunit